MDIRYARSTGDIDIAYTVIGDGPVDLVLVSGFITHLDLSWDLPLFAWLAGLDGTARVITFDKRGTGLSDRTLGFGSIEERADDVRAVMDAAGSERAFLLGASEGGPMSVVFATSSPERVRGLVLYGTAASFMARPGHPSGLEPERVPEVLGMVRERWGTGDVFGLFMQNAPDPAAAQRWLARFERNACSPAVATDVMRRNLEIDVRPLLPALAVPTLVVHHEGDPIVPLASARAMAEQIPGARFRQVPGAVHATWSPDDLLEVRREVHAFLEEGGAPAGAADRALATVLFTDISSSTQLAASVGDRAWHELLDQHDRISARHVEQLGGRLVTTTGDGVLATFDSPARAIRCATALGEALRPVGLRIRSGLHTGEVELRGADVSGLAVVIARRVCDLAARDQVLVSRTVKDLVAGSAIGFVEHGRHTLKGVPDEWELYAASA